MFCEIKKLSKISFVGLPLRVRLRFIFWPQIRVRYMAAFFFSWNTNLETKFWKRWWKIFQKIFNTKIIIKNTTSQDKNLWIPKKTLGLHNYLNFQKNKKIPAKHIAQGEVIGISPPTQLTILFLLNPEKTLYAFLAQSATIFGKLPSPSPPPASFITFKSLSVHPLAAKAHIMKTQTGSQSLPRSGNWKQNPFSIY